MTSKLCVAFSIILITITTACQSGQKEETYRTYYESLSLNTPEEAISTFVQAFQQSDFVTVYMVLAPMAQHELTKSRLYYDSTIAKDLSDEDQEAFIDLWVDYIGITIEEHNLDGLQFFKTMMVAAGELGFLPIYFPGDVTFLDSISSETPNNQIAVDVSTTIDGLDEPLTFRMVQSPENKWRVSQVLWPGSDEGSIPWAKFPTMEITPQASTDINNLHGGYNKLDLSTPESAVQTFSQAFQNRDFPTVYWILHPHTQMDWHFNFQVMRYEKLVKVNEDSISILW